MAPRRVLQRAPVAGVAVLVVLLMLSANVSAGPVRAASFAASYGRFGGLPFTGNNTSAVGQGANVIVGPTFFPHSGGTFLTVWTAASAWKHASYGNYEINAWAGVQNVSFVCPTNCSTIPSGSVVAHWNVSWKATLNAVGPCNGLFKYLVTASLVIEGELIDQTAGGTIAGNGSTVIYSNGLHFGGSVLASSNLTSYVLSFPASLHAGHSYSVVTYLLAHVHAIGGGTGYYCGAWASVQVSTSTDRTALRGITVW
jgi:hypothetical protein